MAKQKIKNMSIAKILENIPSMPRESKKRIMELYGNNLEIIKAILKSEGMFLKYCSDQYKQNKELVIIAVTQNGMALSHADSSIRQDPELVQIVLHTTPFALQIVGASFQTNFDYVKMATDADIRTLQHASLDIRNDYIFVRDLLLRDGQVYPYIGPELKDSEILAYIAISTFKFGYHLVDSLNDIANLLKPNLSMFLEVAHVYRTLNRANEWHISKRNTPPPYRSLLKFVLETSVSDLAWPYVRQAILINPEPFINKNHILRQIMQTPDDWKPIAESILYDDVLRSHREDHTKINEEPLSFDFVL